MTTSGGRPRLIHVTTTDMSLDWLLGPQLSAFASAGYEVIGASAPGPHVAAIEARGIRHEPLAHATRAMAPQRDLQALLELRTLFERLQPTIVHTHNPKPGIYGRLAGRAARVPIVVNTVHGLYATPEDRPLRRAVVYGLEHVAARCSHAELVQNPEDVETLARIGVPRSKLVELGNGVDLDRFDPAAVAPGARARLRAQLGADDDTVVVVAVGRLVREKGYLELFAAATMLRRIAPEVMIVVVGPDDPDKGDALDREAVAGAEAAGVRFLGRRDDVDELYTAFDLYVLASWREGFPRSAMEAAAMALPIVATDVRGCRQVVDRSVTGELVAVRDAVALADAIAALAADPQRREAMGRAARAKAVRDFDQRRVIERTLATYERLRGERGADRPGDGR